MQYKLRRLIAMNDYSLRRNIQLRYYSIDFLCIDTEQWWHARKDRYALIDELLEKYYPAFAVKEQITGVTA